MNQHEMISQLSLVVLVGLAAVAVVGGTGATITAGHQNGAAQEQSVLDTGVSANEAVTVTADGGVTRTAAVDPAVRPGPAFAQDAASFSISNFQGPAEARTGERVTVEATVRNDGESEGSETVEYRVGDRELASQTVTLGAGESRTVSFRVTVPDLTPGTYQQGVFFEGTDTGQTSSLVVTRPTASFSVLSFSGPSEVRIGEEVTVEARVRNTGDADGSSSFQYRIRGRTVDVRSVSIDAGESRTVTFEGRVPSVATGTTDHGVFVSDTSTGLTSRVRVLPREAEFTLSSFDAPSRVPADDPVSVEVRVRNTGSVSGTKTLEYRIDGRTIAERRLSLNPDQSRTITLSGTVPNLRPGTYRQGIYVEGTSTQLTTNLVVEEPSFSISNLRAPSRAGVGDEITIAATVRNDGRRTITRRVEYRIRDRRVAAQTVEIAAGQRRTVTFDVTVPRLPDGTHRQGVFVGNTSTGQTDSLRVTAGSPQFVVTGVTGPEAAVVGDRISVEATLANRGGAGGTARFDYRIGDLSIDSESVQLNSQSSRTVTFEGVVPAVPNGTYRQGVFVRAGQSSSTSLVITSPPRVRPAWLVTDITAPSAGQVGDRITVEAVVRNRGDNRATRRLEYRIGDRVVASRTVSVDAGSEQTVTFDVRIPEVEGGRTTHGVYVGDGPNGRTARIDISVGNPEYVIGDLRAPATAAPGDAITVRASVVNVGRAPGETDLQYRFGDQVVGTQSVSLNPGQRRTVTFEVTVPDVGSDTYSHGVFVGDTDQGQVSSIVIEAPTPTPTASPTEQTDGAGPGFSPVAALLALLGVTIIAVRRHN